ncbi:hypothetical protein [Streptomyces sp. NPDC002952]|uniref:hypothetical protein n=1 Tax=Streptomyces sp. NPDC002952 TaxID=3364673 RepID=UPI003696964A
MRSEPFPAPLSEKESIEVGEIVGALIGSTVAEAALVTGIPARYLLAVCTSSVALDAVTGEFLKSNDAGEAPATAAKRTAEWLRDSIHSVAAEARRQTEGE